MIFTETWLNNNVIDAMLNPLNCYILDRLYNARGGGIIVYGYNNYNYVCITEFVKNGLHYYVYNFLITDL